MWLTVNVVCINFVQQMGLPFEQFLPSLVQQTVEALLESGYSLLKEQQLIMETKLSKEYMKNMEDQNLGYHIILILFCHSLVSGRCSLACCVCIIDNYNPTSAILKGLQIFHCQLHYKSTTVRRVLTLSGYGSVRHIPSVFNIWQSHLNIQVGSPCYHYTIQL